MARQGRRKGLGVEAPHSRRRLDVTRNSIDFRGPATRPGGSGQYADVMLHAGLVCLNAPAGMNLDLQLELFEAALAELAHDSDLVNQVLEVSVDGSDLRVHRYALPA